MKVPAGYTCVAAPPDVAWNHPLKTSLRREWLKDLYEQFNAPRGEDEKFVLKPHGRPVLIKWALNAWENSLSSQNIANGFRAVGIGSRCDYAEGSAGEQSNDDDFEKLSAGVFDHLAKLKLVERNFTVSTDDVDAFLEHDSKEQAEVFDLEDVDEEGESADDADDVEGGDDGREAFLRSCRHDDEEESELGLNCEEYGDEVEFLHSGRDDDKRSICWASCRGSR
jgi:hypothetical protein